MNSLLHIRLPLLFYLVLPVLLLSGCASTDSVRGRLHYDLRPDGQRTDIFWPPPPDKPRYRYAGELIGEPNFEAMNNERGKVETVLKWLVGLFETNTQFLLQRPQHGVTDDKGRIYIVDAGRKAVLVFDPHPPPGDKATKGEGQLLVWDVLDKQTRFSGPVAIAQAWGGDLVVSDVALGLVLRLNNQGELVGKLGAGLIKRPTGLAFDPERGLLFVADTVAHDIKVLDAEGQLVNTIGTPGEGRGELNAPTYLTWAQGLLYVADTYNGRIQIFDAQGNVVSGFGERGLYVGNLTRPKGVTIDDAGILYVVESYYNHLLAYNSDHQHLLGIRGNGAKNDRFLLPSGIWTDRQRRIFIADMFNARVVVFEFLGDTSD